MMLELWFWVDLVTDFGFRTPNHLHKYFYPIVSIMALFTIAFCLNAQVVLDMFKIIKLEQITTQKGLRSRRSLISPVFQYRVSKINIFNYVASIVFSCSLSKIYLEFRSHRKGLDLDSDLELISGSSSYTLLLFTLSMGYLFLVFGMKFVLNEFRRINQEGMLADREKLLEKGQSYESSSTNRYGNELIPINVHGLCANLHTYIASFLSFDEALLLACVSKHWYQIMCLEIQSRRSFDSVDSHPLIMTDHRIMLVAHKCRNIRSLSVKQCLQITDFGVSYAFRMLQSTLVEFDCSGSDLISDKSLLILGFCCPWLRILRVAQCPKVSNIGVECVLSRCFGMIELNVANTNITNSTLYATRNCINMKSLNLSCCFEVSDQGLSQLAGSCRNLEYLNVDRCVRLTDTSIILIANCCRSMKEIHLRGCSAISDSSLYEISKQLLNLAFVDVSECTVTDEGVAHLLNSPSLVSLNVNRPANGGIHVTDACLYLFSVLNNCSNSTNTKFSANSKLECLALSGSKIKFQGQGQNQQGLQLGRNHAGFGEDYSQQISFRSIDLGKRFPCLRSLNLCLCDRITDDFLFLFQSKDFFPRLKKIMLTGASVTNRGLEICLQARPDLRI